MARILIIDDDQRFRGALREMLQDAGYEVIEARDGRPGLDLFRAKPTDLVITDIIMPDVEGIEVIVELRSEFPDVPILAISGGSLKGFGSYLPSAEALGATRSLDKPFRQQVLLDTVRELLSEPLSPASQTP